MFSRRTVVNRDVDEAQAVLLAGLHGHLTVVAVAIRILVGTVDEAMSSSQYSSESW